MGSFCFSDLHELALPDRIPLGQRALLEHPDRAPLAAVLAHAALLLGQASDLPVLGLVPGLRLALGHARIVTRTKASLTLLSHRLSAPGERAPPVAVRLQLDDSGVRDRAATPGTAGVRLRARAGTAVQIAPPWLTTRADSPRCWSATSSSSVPTRSITSVPDSAPSIRASRSPSSHRANVGRKGSGSPGVAGVDAHPELAQPVPDHHVDAEDGRHDLGGLDGAGHRAGVDPGDPGSRSDSPSSRDCVRPLPAQAAAGVAEQLRLVLRLAVPGDVDPGRAVQVAHGADARPRAGCPHAIASSSRGLQCPTQRGRRTTAAETASQNGISRAATQLVNGTIVSTARTTGGDPDGTRQRASAHEGRHDQRQPWCVPGHLGEVDHQGGGLSHSRARLGEHLGRHDRAGPEARVVEGVHHGHRGSGRGHDPAGHAAARQPRAGRRRGTGRRTQVRR